MVGRLAASPVAEPGCEEDEMALVLEGGTLIDGSGRDPVPGSRVVVEGERIASVGGQRPRDAEPLEVTGLTVLPGLIDLHTHMGILSAAAPEAIPPAVAAAQLFRNAELCLLSGHTTAREVAGADGGLRQAIDAGLVAGPRLFPSGPALCQSGGHGDLSPAFLPHHHDPGVPGLAQMTIVCDGPDRVRAAARTAFRRGATQLKVIISGGIVSLTDRLEDTQFTVEELRAAVAEARARDTYVTGHAHNVASIRNGLEAGLECFEHGTFLDEETAAQMAAAGAALVPTLTTIRLLASEWRAWGVPEAVLPRVTGAEEAMREAVKIAYAAGVTVGSGTDILGPEQNRRGLELALKAEIVGPMEAIVSATATNARILRRDHELGTVQPGKLADLIAVAGDPLADPTLFDDPDRVVLVVQGGRVVKDTRDQAA
jgi:imidazolonepropionase-like amidohydrolase